MCILHCFTHYLSPNDCYSHENASFVSPSIGSITGREPSCCTWNPVWPTSEEHSCQVRDWLGRGHRQSERGQRGREVLMASLSFLRFALQYKVFLDFSPSPGLYTYTGVWQLPLPPCLPVSSFYLKISSMEVHSESLWEDSAKHDSISSAIFLH